MLDLSTAMLSFEVRMVPHGQDPSWPISPLTLYPFPRSLPQRFHWSTAPPCGQSSTWPLTNPVSGSRLDPYPTSLGSRGGFERPGENEKERDVGNNTERQQSEHQVSPHLRHSKVLLNRNCLCLSLGTIATPYLYKNYQKLAGCNGACL